MAPKHITVLGGGLTGLTAAYRLAERLPSTEVVLLEATQRLGGWVDSQRYPIQYTSDGKDIRGEIVLEGGPRSIRPRGSRGAVKMLKLLQDLDLEGAIRPIPNSHPSAKNRFLLGPTGSLQALPSSALSLLRSPYLRDLLYGGLTEPFRRRSLVPDESVDGFFRRRLGPAIADKLASAMVHGIYAADSRDVSLRSAFPVLYEAERKRGSVVLGMLLGTKSPEEKRLERESWDDLGPLGKEREGWSLYSLQGGLGPLTSRLAERVRQLGVKVHLGNPVTALSTSDTNIEVSTSENTFITSHLVSALPPHRLAPLVPLPNLQSNPLTSVGVINLVFPLPPAQVHPAGFGYLIPRSGPSQNPEGVLGVIFDSTALDTEGEPPVCKLTVMMGGPYWSSYASTSGRPMERPSNATELVQPALRHLRRVFPHLQDVEPVLVRPKLHIECIPTYLPGHGGRLRELHEAISSGPWKDKLSLVGSGYGGIGVNDCVGSAEEVVDALAQGHNATGLERWADWS